MDRACYSDVSISLWLSRIQSVVGIGLALGLRVKVSVFS